MPDMDNIEKMLQQILTEQASMKEQLKGALRRIDEQTKLAESVHELATSIKLLSAEHDTTKKTVDGLRTDVDEIKQKPGKRWDSATTIILTAIIGAVCGFLLNKFGLK